MGRLMTRIVEWVWRTFGALLERLASVGFIQTGVVLAAQTFLALLPLLIVVSAFAPSAVSDSVSHTLRSRLGLSGSTDQIVDSVLNSRDSLRGSISVFGVLVALASATSFTRALQRTYELSWGLPRGGLRGSVRGLVWLAGLAIYLTVLGVTLHLIHGGPPITLVRGVLTWLGAVMLWWWTPFVLLLGRVRPLALLPSGVLSGVTMIALGWVSSIYVPRSIRTNEQHFGTLGSVFAIESWLVIVACALVASAVVGAVLVQTGGPFSRRYAALLSGSGTQPWRRRPDPPPGAFSAAGRRDQ